MVAVSAVIGCAVALSRSTRSDVACTVVSETLAVHTHLIVRLHIPCVPNDIWLVS
jgi:hypothetical protein